MKKELVFTLLKAILGFLLSLIPLGLLIATCVNEFKVAYLIIFGLMFIYLFFIGVSWIIEFRKMTKTKN